jgi:Dynein heavy chain, N-terminal region 2.
VFSRFYFLSNDELLDILANSKNVKQIQTYLPKCFFNVHRLKFDMSQRAPVPICGMLSEEGEYMELAK